MGKKELETSNRDPHGGVEEHNPDLNSGVFIVSDPDFYDYDDIINAPIVYKDLLRRPLHKWSDQFFLANYFKSIGYDPFVEDITGAWNASAYFVNLHRKQGTLHAEFKKHMYKDDAVKIVHYWTNNRILLWGSEFFKEFEG